MTHPVRVDEATELLSGETCIGVAIAIPEPHLSYLVQARRDYGDPQADNVPAHITLLGPTVVRRDEMDEVLQHLRHVSEAHAVFNVHLRGVATFRPVSPVVFVALSRGIAECERLEADIRTGPLWQETRFNYHPHVTIAQNVSDAQLDTAMSEQEDFTAQFEVDRIYLYEHQRDGVWRPQCSFLLEGTSAGGFR